MRRVVQVDRIEDIQLLQEQVREPLRVREQVQVHNLGEAFVLGEHSHKVVEDNLGEAFVLGERSHKVVEDKMAVKMTLEKKQ